MGLCFSGLFGLAEISCNVNDIGKGCTEHRAQDYADRSYTEYADYYTHYRYHPDYSGGLHRPAGQMAQKHKGPVAPEIKPRHYAEHQKYQGPERCPDLRTYLHCLFPFICHDTSSFLVFFVIYGLLLPGLSSLPSTRPPQSLSASLPQWKRL